MNRLFVLAGCLAVAVIVAGVRAEDDKKEEKPNIKKLMKVMHGKAPALQAKASAALKAKDFEKLEKVSAEWEKSATVLAKAKPTKGESESWEKLTGSYLKAIKTMHEAAEKKDAKSANGALGQIGKSCGVCHKAHK